MSEVKTYAVNCNDAWLNTEGDDISCSYVKYADYAALQAKCASLEAENELAIEAMKKADAAVKLVHEKFLSMDDEIQKLRNAYSREPMAWIHYDNGLGIPAITRSKAIADDWISRGWRVIHLHAKLIGESNGDADENMHCDTTAQQFESLAKSE